MPKSHYKIENTSNDLSFNQTDFGRIYYDLPTQVLEPVTVEDLALTLKNFNSRLISVKIRNTGHSVNGQTLTDGVQISLARIKKLHFDEEALEVTAGAGNTWDQVLNAVNFPKYCLPMFPNNPGQMIRIGGTASVGGIGHYSSRVGGFWNHVKRLKLVTMKGDIITCSPKENPDLFKFALGGFGRIGVIAEITINVTPSFENMLVLIAGYTNFKSYRSSLADIYEDNYFNGVVGLTQISSEKFYDPLKFIPYGLLLAKELQEGDSPDLHIEFLKKNYQHTLLCFYGDKNPSSELQHNSALKSEGLFFTAHTFSKKSYAYFYPEDHINKSGHFNPWADFVLKPNQYQNFIEDATRIIKHYGIHKHLLHHSGYHDFLNADMFLSYMLRRQPDKLFMPLSLDFSDSDVSVSVGLSPVVPFHKIEDSLKMIKALDELVFGLGGKRYMYGIHSLTKDQIKQQYGIENIEKWNDLKDQLDPNRLLNIGVIEHLDNWS